MYYIAGFDTRSARFYHPLYQTEAALQQAIDGCHYEVGPLEPAGEHTTAWTVQADHGGQAVRTRYHFMAWNDIIRQHWPASTWRVAATVPAFFWRFVRSGAWGGTWRIARPFFWMLSLPLWMTVASLLLGLLLGAVTAALLGALLPAGTLNRMDASLAHAGVGLGVLALGLRYTEQLRIYWLMRAWTFMWRWICQSLPASGHTLRPVRPADRSRPGGRTGRRGADHRPQCRGDDVAVDRGALARPARPRPAAAERR